MAEAGRRSWNWRGLMFPLAILAACELAAIAVALESDSLARPSEILVAGLAAITSGTVFLLTVETLAAAFGGLFVGGSIGFVLGVLFGRVNLLDRLMFVSVEVLRPIPSVATIPIAMLVFGFGFGLEVSVVAFATLWPMLILSRAAVLSIDPRLVEVGRLLTLPWYEFAAKIVLPSILPRLFVALRLSAMVAIIVAVTVEIAANPIGLGYAMMEAQQTLRPGLTFALLLWIGLVGWAINWLLLALETSLAGRSGLADTGGRT